MPYFYSGNASSSKLLTRGGALVAGLDSQVSLALVQVGYAPQEKLWGGQAFVGVAGGLGHNRTTIDADLMAGTGVRSRSDAQTGGTDLYPIASLAWNQGVHNVMTYVTGDIPVGAYDSKRLANLGIGHAAIDAGGGYTYLNQTTGQEFSAVAGLTYNWRNTDTDYKNGIDFHLDWAASQFLSASWQVGVAGYVYQQLTSDSYPTGGVVGAMRKQALGGFKSRVAAIGPQLGYLFKAGNKQAYANLRAYKEFWAQNRVEGYAVIATISIPF